VWLYEHSPSINCMATGWVIFNTIRAYDRQTNRCSEATAVPVSCCAMLSPDKNSGATS